MAHTSSRHTPSWGSRPSSSSGSTRLPPTSGDLQPTLENAPPLLNAPPLGTKELSAGTGTGVHINNESLSTSDSTFSHSLVPSLQNDELNTPEVVPPSPFRFSPISGLNSLGNDDLMDAILTAPEPEEERTGASLGTDQANAHISPASALPLYYTLDNSEETNTLNGSFNEEQSMPGSRETDDYAAVLHDVLLSSQPAAQRTLMNTATAPAQHGSASCLPIKDTTISSCVSFSKDGLILAQAQGDNVACGLSEWCGLPTMSTGTTEATQPDPTKHGSGSQLSDDRNWSVEPMITQTETHPSSLGSNLDVKRMVVPSTSGVSLFNNVILTVNNESSVPNLNTLLAPASEALPLKGVNQTDDSFLYSFQDLPSSLKNVDELSEEEMKDVGDFCSEILKDDNNDLFGTEFSNEETLGIAGNSTTSGTGLDHSSLLSATIEPGQLLASRTIEPKQNWDSEHCFADTIEKQGADPLRVFPHAQNSVVGSVAGGREGQEVGSAFGDVGNPQVGSLGGDDGSRNVLSNDIDGSFRLPGSNSSWNSPVFEKDLDIDIYSQARTPLRRHSVLQNTKKTFDGEILFKKLEHLEATSQEHVESSGHSQSLCAEAANDVDMGRQRDQMPRVPGTEAPHYSIEFDPALKVPPMAAPQTPQPTNTITVQVLKNKSSLRLPQKPVKRLVPSCPVIKTVKVQLAPRSALGRSATATVPVATALVSVGKGAVFNVPSKVSNVASIEGRNESSMGNLYSVVPENTFNVKSSTPISLVRFEASESFKLLAQMPHSSVKQNTGGKLQLPADSSSSYSHPAPPAVDTFGDSAITLLPTAEARCSQSFTPVVSGATACQNQAPTGSDFKSQPAVAGPSRSRRQAVASTSGAQDGASYDSDSSDVSYEPEGGDRYGRPRAARDGDPIVGFSRLPRRAQLALDAEKYRKNLKANNIASRKSRLKKKKALLALEEEVKKQEEERVLMQRNFDKLQLKYETMFQVISSRPCCPDKN